MVEQLTKFQKDRNSERDQGAHLPGLQPAFTQAKKEVQRKGLDQAVGVANPNDPSRTLRFTDRLKRKGVCKDT